MAPRSKRSLQLKNSRIKRLTHVQARVLGSISQRVALKNNHSTFELYEKEEKYSFEDLNEFYLDIVTNAFRERNWGAKMECLFGVSIFIVLSLATNLSTLYHLKRCSTYYLVGVFIGRIIKLVHFLMVKREKMWSHIEKYL